MVLRGVVCGQGFIYIENVKGGIWKSRHQDSLSSGASLFAFLSTEAQKRLGIAPPPRFFFFFLGGGGGCHSKIGFLGPHKFLCSVNILSRVVYRQSCRVGDFQCRFDSAQI